MSNFDEQLARMKGLMTYGKANEEANAHKSYTLEHHAVAADGKTYGIIRECNKFYIKKAEPGKEMLAESYNYIGGFNNKKDYEYLSYPNALKNFELKMASIAEACEGAVNIETLDPFKKEDVIVEGTEKMKNELARVRQLMHNTSVLMNESTEIGATPFKNQPEAETEHSGDKDQPYTNEVKPEMEYDGKTQSCPKCAGEPFDKGEKGCKTECGEDIEVKDSVASMHPTGGKVAKVNEGCDECGMIGEVSDEEETTDTDTEDVTDLDIEDEDGENHIDDLDIENDDETDDDQEELDVDLDGDTEGGCEGEECPVEGDENDPEYLKSEINRLLDKLKNLVPEEDTETKEEPVAVEDVPEEGQEVEPDVEVKAETEEMPEEMPKEVPAEEDGHEEDLEELNEENKKYMNSIVESVVKEIIAEDELHIFGQHPGYRKKPMTLPTTGEDKNEHGADINDDSVHNEEPFGKQIGKGTPFEDAVEKVSNSILEALKKKNC